MIVDTAGGGGDVAALMTPELQDESDKLLRSWMRHDAAMLRDYLVASVEDPRINVQSALTRHFLTRRLTGERFGRLMVEEYRFCAVMNWLARVPGLGDEETRGALRYALERGADNVEGIEVPAFVLEARRSLPIQVAGMVVPDYLGEALEGRPGVRDTFLGLWRAALDLAAPAGPRPTVLEVACGSANDYRALAACGLGGLIDYTGIDLCPRNIDNAREIFPGARFETGNVFAIDAADHAFEQVFTHDLFEHLSPEGIEAAVGEICRVARRQVSVGFFHLDEIPEHQIQPVEDYHWNLLAMERMRESFAARGFTAQVIHVGTFLRQQTGCPGTHNPNAYTFWLERMAR